jgi:ankyrin repeat protein
MIRTGDPDAYGLQNWDIKSEELASPLCYTASLGALQLTDLLITNGANINERPPAGRFGNALQAAAWSGNESIVRLLLDRGADINAQGGRCGNALQAAAYRGYESIAQLLLDRGADINAQGGES